MKKFLSLLLIVCMIATVLPFAAFADDTYVTVRVNNGGSYLWYGATDKQMKAGDATRYLATTEDGVVSVGTADNWNIMLEYPADGNPKVTLKGAVLKAEKNEFPLSIMGSASCTLYIQEDSHLYTTNRTALYISAGGLTTITGPGKLTIDSTDGSCIGFAGSATNLKAGAGLIKDANLQLNPVGTSTGRMGISFFGGDLTIDNSKIDITGSSDKSVGIWGYATITRDENGNVTKVASHWAMTDGDVERNVTIQNGSVITGKTAVKFFGASGSVIIKDSTVEVESKNVFEKKPVLEGEYSAVGGAKKDKPVAYNPSKAVTYKYFKVVPGTVELIPTEATTAPTEPTPTEPVTVPTEPVTVPSTEPVTVPTQPEATQAPTQAPDATQAPTKAPADNSGNTQTPADDTASDSTGLIIALVVIGGIAVLAGATLVLLWFVIKPKWLVKTKK